MQALISKFKCLQRAEAAAPQNTQRSPEREASEVPEGWVGYGPESIRHPPASGRYMCAMAELGAGPHRSGDVAELLEKRVTTVAPTRNSLIAKGMIYSPSHGETAFTVV